MSRLGVHLLGSCLARRIKKISGRSLASNSSKKLTFVIHLNLQKKKKKKKKKKIIVSQLRQNARQPCYGIKFSTFLKNIFTLAWIFFQWVQLSWFARQLPCKYGKNIYP